MGLWPCGFKTEYTYLGFASAEIVWLGIWNSDRVVLKSNTRTLASPRQQRSQWGLRVTQDAYFSLMTHTKQLLLVTFCDNTAGNGAFFRTHGTTDGWTDRHDSRNIYLDLILENIPFIFSSLSLCDSCLKARLENRTLAPKTFFFILPTFYNLHTRSLSLFHTLKI